MQEYKPLSDEENVGDVASNMVQQAWNPKVHSVKIESDNYTVVVGFDDAENVTITVTKKHTVSRDDSVEALQTILETITDEAVDEAVSEPSKEKAMKVYLTEKLLADFVGGEVRISDQHSRIISVGEVESFSLEGNDLHITWARLETWESSGWVKSEQKETCIRVWGNPPLGEDWGLGRIKVAHQHPTVMLYPSNSPYKLLEQMGLE